MKIFGLILVWSCLIKPVWAADLDTIIQHASQQTGVPVMVINAVIQQESNGNKKAVSHKGAKGLMQLMPATAKRFGVSNVFDPKQNILAGSRYLAWLYHRFGNWPLALAGYNAGEGRVDQYGGIPPYRETRLYVKKIMTHIRQQQYQQATRAKVQPQPVALAKAPKRITPVKKTILPKQTPVTTRTTAPTLPRNDDSLMLLQAALNAPTVVNWKPPAGYYP